MTLEDLYKIFKEKHLDVSTDTRKINPGDIFFALKGENFDGNEFVKEAIGAGASFVVSENPDFPMDRGVFVKDSLLALQDFAKMYREDLSIPIIAITGSNGKTTTKELVKEVLSQDKKVFASPASFNNHIGVPLSILSIKPEHEVAVIEMGDNHEGEITALCEIAKPTHGLITNIGHDHIGMSGGYEANVRSKLEFYKYITPPLGEKGPINFLNYKDEMLVKESSGLNNVLYVSGEVLPGADKQTFVVDGIEIKTNLFGEFNLDNIRAAFTIGKYFEVDTEKIKKALESFEPKSNRSQIKKTDKNAVVLDAYNANPESMALAIKSFEKMDGEKMMILGDMFELGQFAEEEHRKIIQIVEKAGIKTFFVGSEFKRLESGVGKFFESREGLVSYLKNENIENKTILIKGSRGMALEKILEENVL